MSLSIAHKPARCALSRSLVPSHIVIALVRVRGDGDGDGDAVLNGGRGWRGLKQRRPPSPPPLLPLSPSCLHTLMPAVAALKSLQKDMMLRPACPRAGPTGGAGLAAPAPMRRRMRAATVLPDLAAMKACATGGQGGWGAAGVSREGKWGRESEKNNATTRPPQLSFLGTERQAKPTHHGFQNHPRRPARGDYECVGARGEGDTGSREGGEGGPTPSAPPPIGRGVAFLAAPAPLPPRPAALCDRGRSIASPWRRDRA